ncbi:MAG: hypothetical protein ACJ789_04920 [Thermomicrobiales bacterium]
MAVCAGAHADGNPGRQPGGDRDDVTTLIAIWCAEPPLLIEAAALFARIFSLTVVRDGEAPRTGSPAKRAV